MSSFTAVVTDFIYNWKHNGSSNLTPYFSWCTQKDGNITLKMKYIFLKFRCRFQEFPFSSLQSLPCFTSFSLSSKRQLVYHLLWLCSAGLLFLQRWSEIAEKLYILKNCTNSTNSTGVFNFKTFCFNLKMEKGHIFLKACLIFPLIEILLETRLH